jgi:hypothetical protein
LGNLPKFGRTSATAPAEAPIASMPGSHRTTATDGSLPSSMSKSQSTATNWPPPHCSNMVSVPGVAPGKKQL